MQAPPRRYKSDHIKEAKGSFAEGLTHLAVSIQLKYIPGRRDGLCEDWGRLFSEAG